jgi:hypothetical protein
MTQNIQSLELVDGCGKVLAVMVTPPPEGLKSCAPDRHCAHHGSDPFFCCRCGASFTFAVPPWQPDPRWRHRP